MENNKKPTLGDKIRSHNSAEEAVRLLALRRSTPADFLTEPGPDKDILGEILEIAARVPDHRRVTPFRFVVFAGDARASFGEVLAAAFLGNEPNAEEAKVEFERNRFLRAPIVVAVISSLNKTHRTPEWEQILTAGAVCQNMLLAANAFGFASQWLTEWYAFDAAIASALELNENERFAGFIYIGTAKEDPKERARPDMDAITSNYQQPIG